MAGRRRKRRTNTNPLKAVTESRLWSGRVGINLRSGSVVEYEWRLTLECGHETERPVRYPKGASEGRRGWARLHHPPANRAEIALPPPKRVRCARCGRNADQQP